MIKNKFVRKLLGLVYYFHITGKGENFWSHSNSYEHIVEKWNYYKNRGYNVTPIKSAAEGTYYREAIKNV